MRHLLNWFRRQLFHRFILTAFSPDSATRFIPDTRRHLAIREISTPLMAGAMGYVSELLGIPLPTLKSKLKKYDIT